MNDKNAFPLDWPDGRPRIPNINRRTNGKQLCFACDRWHHIQDNMHAIGLTIEALRGIARWGTGDMMEAAFRGFAALPAPGQSGLSWWQVLGVAMNANEDQIRDAYRALVKKHHPDTGGNREQFEQVQKAWEEFRIKYAC
jgi:hypothetical protein